MKPIRIAMLQCERAERDECHSYHFAPFMDDCDPMVLKDVWPTSYQYHTDLNHPDEFFNVPKVDGFEIVSVWDVQSLQRAETFSRYVNRRPKVCPTIDQAIDQVDAVFLADGGGDGSEHLKWVEPILRRRLPAFVDKPFASTFRNAKTMVDLTHQFDTPLFSASILSFVNEIDHFRAAWRRIGDPGLAVIKGVGPSMGAVVHGLGLMQGLFGTGVEWVESMGALPREIMRFQYANGLEVVLLNTAYRTFDWFSCEVWAGGPRTNPPRKIYARSETIGDPEFLPASHKIIQLFKQMIEVRKPPVPYENALEQAALLEAGLKAQEIGKRVYLKDVMA